METLSGRIRAIFAAAHPALPDCWHSYADCKGQPSIKPIGAQLITGLRDLASRALWLGGYRESKMDGGFAQV